jgi:predicted phosphoribosyltransferase
MVAIEVAKKLKSVIMMLLTEDVELPREPDPIGGLTMDGSFGYNTAYSSGELDEMVSEYHNFIEQEKMHKMHVLNRLNDQGLLMRRDLLDKRTVFLISDGLADPFELELAFKYLKPVRTQKLVIATPLASVPAIDYVHVHADEIFCLNVVRDFISVQHYYDTYDVPEHDVIIRTIDHIVTAWQNEPVA